VMCKRKGNFAWNLDRMYRELSREYEFKYESVTKTDITKDYFPL